VRNLVHVSFSMIFATPLVAQQQTPTAEDLIHQLTTPDPSRRVAASEALLGMGAGAVPALCECLVPGQEWSRRESEAIKLLGRLRRHAVPAVPRLLRRLKQMNGAQSDRVLDALDEIAPYAPDRFWDIERAIDDLFDQSMRQDSKYWIPSRGRCYRTMNRLAVNVESSTYKMMQLLVKGNTFQRELAADLLVESPGESAPKIEALCRCLRRAPGKERVVLEMNGPKVRIVLGRMVDNSTAERRHVARAIVLLAPQKDVPIGAWVVMLGHEDSRLVMRAIQALAISGRPDGVEGLIALTASKNGALAWEAITALGVLGPTAKAAETRLEELSKIGDHGVSTRSAIALRAIRPRD
jgi:hypothetical protein